jgi:hypothetical protein
MQMQSTVLRTDLRSPLNEPQRLSVSARGRFDSDSEVGVTTDRLAADFLLLFVGGSCTVFVNGQAIYMGSPSWIKFPCRCQFTNPRSTGQAESGERCCA